ncbi:hypothetical protein GX50_08869 [[Emmonsia] crescens]|uniref:Uncharacterized protein n=1 Tax=[Emmonsia] crescens TaxID=73230 RepID=A0A2B7YWE2_9EURO|nr:hypothetical protein GX50_08869 [Emmonsia crescens]
MINSQPVNKEKKHASSISCLLSHTSDQYSDVEISEIENLTNITDETLTKFNTADDNDTVDNNDVNNTMKIDIVNDTINIIDDIDKSDFDNLNKPGINQNIILDDNNNLNDSADDKNNDESDFADAYLSKIISISLQQCK